MSLGGLDAIGRWQVVGELGSGAYGSVYEVVDNHGLIDRVGALKVMKRESSGLDDEVRRLSSLRHDNIVDYLDSGVVDGSDDYFLVMEKCDESLADRLRRSPMDDHEAEALARNILSGLAYLHEHNVVHRDIKPANVLFAGGRWKVGDFGEARIVAGDGLYEPSVMSSGEPTFGTPRFLAPEALEPGSVSGKLDVWAAGLTVLTALLGYAPEVVADETPQNVADRWRPFFAAAFTRNQHQRPNAADLSGKLSPRSQGSDSTVHRNDTVLRAAAPSEELKIEPEPVEPRRDLRIPIAIGLLMATLVGVGLGFVLLDRSEESQQTQQVEVIEDAGSSEEVEDGEPATTITVSTTTTPATTSPEPAAGLESEATTSSTPASLPSTTTSEDAATTTAASSCGSGSISAIADGVAEFVNVRSGPGTNFGVVTEFAAGRSLTAFLADQTSANGRTWVPVDAAGVCGWVAGDLFTGLDGYSLTRSPMSSYVGRALVGLNPSALHAREIFEPGTNDGRPFDDTALFAPLSELRSIGAGSQLVVQPDTVNTQPGEEAGCTFSDGLHCRFFLEAAGDRIGTVDVSSFGDGITGLDVQIASIPQPAPTQRGCGADQLTLLSGTSTGGGTTAGDSAGTDVFVAVCRSADGALSYYGLTLRNNLDIRLGACLESAQTWRAENNGTIYRVVDLGSNARITVRTPDQTTQWVLNQGLSRNLDGQAQPSTGC